MVLLLRRLCGSRLAACAAAAAAAAAAATLAAGASVAHADGTSDQQRLPVDKLACHLDAAPPRTPTVLVCCGSFNPPTIMHMRMFDLATAALAQRGHDVLGSYMSPVADAYGKQGLAPVQHRLEMCRLAAADSPGVMVDAWEAGQAGYTRTLQVLRHVSSRLQAFMQQPDDRQQQPSPAARSSHGAPAPQQALAGDSSPSGSTSSSGGGQASAAPPPAAQGAAAPRVMLLCGADLLATLDTPGVWKDPDAILREHGIVCVCRAGTDVEQLLRRPGGLLARHAANVLVVQEPVPNSISSTAVRRLLAAGQPVRYLVPGGVLDYIQRHGLYASP